MLYQQIVDPSSGGSRGSCPLQQPRDAVPMLYQQIVDPSSGGSRGLGPLQQPRDAVPMLYQQIVDPSSGGSRGSGPLQQPRDAVPMLYQQMLRRSPVFWYSPIHNTGDAQLPAVAGGMLTVPYNMIALPICDALGRPIAAQALAAALENALPEQRSAMLGQALYPLADNLEPDSVYSYDFGDGQHRVAEAMDVLWSYIAPEDQLASPSMN
ncbi:putative polyadenylate-binding protein/Hyperplastic disc protein [Lupinus albus]|uniref:Putative polyadenylate-binding protein/Hyperplastic disc protein n=1 Tax=Lupinus albus TaxID=3870 RepID=A0A6A4PPY3_LUPAL|nr:putative polyadenylate-binding protein/Hyperplastic disc protein [Lupinus albus]